MRLSPAQNAPMTSPPPGHDPDADDGEHSRRLARGQSAHEKPLRRGQARQIDLLGEAALRQRQGDSWFGDWFDSR